MPDIWTFNREKVKKALIAQGATCEQEARVLEKRDPFWTCHIDLDEVDPDGVIGYDIYLHDMKSLYVSPQFLSIFTILFVSGTIIGYSIKMIFSNK